MKTANIEVEYIQHCGDDLAVVNAARVSFDKESAWELACGTPGTELSKCLSEKDEKLISYLAKHKHTSPFNHTFITLRVKAPIFVSRQLVKHKFMPWNEVSRRYVDTEPEFFFPDYWRESAENVKQGSSEERCEYMYTEQWDGTETAHPYAAPGEMIDRDIESILNWYKDIIRNGCAPEQARMILPQNMMIEWYWSGTLGAYADMLRLRLDSHAQYETRIVAQKAREIIEPLFPVSLPALLEN